jgi:ankyrin repeat protein
VANTSFVDNSHSDPKCRFRWAYCQLVYLRGSHPGSIRRALAELPDSLDETYERTLGEINKADAELAHRLFQCVTVASRPLRVEELAELLAFNFNAASIPKFREDWRLEDPVEAVLSTCSTLLSLVDTGYGSRVVQFSHFSVKEFLTSSRFAEKHDTISCRYHISLIPAHTLAAQARLGMLLHLDEAVSENDLKRLFPLAEYAGEHWFEHARFEGVPENVEEGIKQLFDTSKPHLAVWTWIHDPNPFWRSSRRPEIPLPPRGTPLHYAVCCGLHTVVKSLVMQRPQDVHSQGVDDLSTPLHIASEQGDLGLAQFLPEHGARMSAKDKEGQTPLHLTKYHGKTDTMQFLIEHDACVSAKDNQGSTLLHRVGVVDIARFLVERGAPMSAKDKEGQTPLHRAVKRGQAYLVRFLVDRGAHVSAKDKKGSTPLHLAAENYQVNIARFLVEHGARVSTKDKKGRTPLHQAVELGLVDLTQFLVEHGARVSAKDKEGLTALHLTAEDYDRDFWSRSAPPRRARC